ncbi:disease resistance protein RPM1-like isoform X1 [Henckelia pumila]|uniref:disease resistance protein RPM1-like isoform X1 n=1 Tax=Henckelia pumila TaxID=405737 RepID=UPI003C6DBEE5
MEKSQNSGSSSKTYDTRGDALLLEEEEVVGIEEPKKQLFGWLKPTGDGLMVVSVVGMGGLGKIFELTIGVELQGDYPKRINRLWSLSYYDLPYYLKACFLYFSIFPEDYLFAKWEVIQLWVAEGFVEGKEGMTTEDVAETYLNELLNRSLIQVADTYDDGSPGLLCIHDILREYIISKSREQNVFKGEMVYPDKIRRMAIHGRFKEREEFPDVKYLRSLFWLEFAPDSKSELDLQKFLGQCKLLKVLNLREAPIETIPNEMVMFAYEGEELLFKGRKFKKLEVLSLVSLRRLTSVRVEKYNVSSNNIFFNV